MPLSALPFSAKNSSAMSQILHIVDAFADRPFSGNPAAVCLREEPANEDWMKLVAREMNLAETAFLHPVDDGFSLRWLTPQVEVKLCGHATLASAFVLWQTGRLGVNEPARFHTQSGLLTCRQKNGWIEMDFPAVAPVSVPVPAGMAEALGCEVSACGSNEMDYLVEVSHEAILRGLRPDFALLAALPVRGVIVTCRSDAPEFDFLSRFFAPAAGINEDPVTGSAHCALGPYWQGKLGKNEFTAFQASERGGLVKLTVVGERVLLKGRAVMMSRVELLHPSPQ